MPKKYLICADGSESSKNALSMVKDLFNNAHDQLFILSVGVFEPKFWDTDREKNTRIVAKERENALALVEEYKKLAAEMGFENVRGEVLVGGPREVIVSFSENNAIDVIAM